MSRKKRLHKSKRRFIKDSEEDLREWVSLTQNEEDQIHSQREEYNKELVKALEESIVFVPELSKPKKEVSELEYQNRIQMAHIRSLGDKLDYLTECLNDKTIEPLKLEQKIERLEKAVSYWV